MHRSRVPGLTAVAVGLVVVAIDFRTEALDLVPDPIGWLLVAYGMWTVRSNMPAILAIVAGMLALSDVYLDFEYVLLNPLTLEVVQECPPGLRCPEDLRYFHVGTIRAAIIASATAVGGTAIALFMRHLVARVNRSDYPSLRGQIRLAATVFPVAWAVPSVAVVGVETIADGMYMPVWDGGLAFVSVPLMLVLLASSALIWRTSRVMGRTLESGWKRRI